MNNSPKTIVFIINVGWYFGLHWLDRAISIKSQGYNVKVISNWNIDKELALATASYGIQCIHLNITRRKSSLFLEIATLYSLFRKIADIKPDIIHSVTVKPNIFAGLVAVLFQVPFIASVTGLGMVFTSSKPFYVLARVCILLLYRLISFGVKSKFLFENEDDRSLFIKKRIVRSNQAFKINGAGVNTDIFSLCLEPTGECTYILFAARMLKEKGLEDLIFAVRDMQASGINVMAQVAGIFDDADPDSIPFSLIQSWQDNGYLNWLGTRRDMHVVIAQTNIVCLPTRYAEGIPRILIEGASCGRALVAPNVPGCNEIIVDGINGLLYSKDLSPSLVDCLSFLVCNPTDRRLMGEAGRRIVLSKYSHENVMSTLVEAYSD